MQEVGFKAETIAQPIEQNWNVIQVALGRPGIFAGNFSIRRFIKHLIRGYTIGGTQPRNPRLRTDRKIAQFDVLGDFIGRFFNITSIGVTVNHDGIPAFAAEQLVQGHAGHLGLDVPQRRIDCCNR